MADSIVTFFGSFFDTFRSSGKVLFMRSRFSFFSRTGPVRDCRDSSNEQEGGETAHHKS
jgi:hypothetical protein